MARSLIRRQRDNHVLADAIGNDRKGSISIALYGAGIALSLLLQPWLGFARCIAVAHASDPRPPHQGPRRNVNAALIAL